MKSRQAARVANHLGYCGTHDACSSSDGEFFENASLLDKIRPVGHSASVTPGLLMVSTPSCFRINPEPSLSPTANVYVLKNSVCVPVWSGAGMEINALYSPVEVT